MLHFLAMYRYLIKDEGEFELHENHFSISQELLVSKFPRTYQPVLYQYYTEPLQKEAITSDFGINVDFQPINFRLILRNSTGPESPVWNTSYWTYRDFKDFVTQLR